MRRVRLGAVLVFMATAFGGSLTLRAQTKPVTKAAIAKRKLVVTDSAAAMREYLEADDSYYETRVLALRARYLRGAAWADLGDRCNPGSLRVFPSDTLPAQRDALQQLAEQMESTVLARGIGAQLDTRDARALLRVIVGWEAGIDRPRWDGPEKVARSAIATGLTGEVPDPRGNGCLKSPTAADTVTFVVPGFAAMDFPSASSPRVKGYFGPLAQQHARDEFYAAVGRRDVTAELSYILVAPMVIWRGWALVGVDRPREKGGVEIGVASNGGAVYLMHRIGMEWRLLSVVRSWGS